MNATDPKDNAADAESKQTRADDDRPSVPEEAETRPTEIGGRDGPDPTRYGDWEKNGRCIDF